MPFSPTGAGSGSIAFGVTGPGPLIDNAIPRMNGITGLIIQGYTSNTPTFSDSGVPTVPALSAAVNVSAVPIFNSTGEESLSVQTYDSAYAGPAGTGAAHPSFVFTQAGIGGEYTRNEANTNSFRFIDFLVTTTPTADQLISTSNTYDKVTLRSTGTFDVGLMTGHDTVVNHVSTGDLLGAATGYSSTVQNNAAVAANALVGYAALMRPTVAGSSVNLLYGYVFDPTSDGATSRGSITNWRPFVTDNLNTDANLTATNRSCYYAGENDGSVAGTDYGWEMRCTQPNYARGDIILGTTSGIFIGGELARTAGVDIEFLGDNASAALAHTIQVRRSTVASHIGGSLSIISGGGVSGGTNRQSGQLSLAPGANTGSGASTVAILTYDNTAGATSDNSLVNRIVVTNNKIGIFNTTPVIQQTSGENLTNNVTAGGVNGTIADYADLTIYANDAAAIRNNIYQLARKLKQVNDGLRAYGWLT